MQILRRVPLGTAVRLGLCAASLVVAIAAGRLAPALPWALLLGSIELLAVVFATFGPDGHRRNVGWLLVGASALGAGFALGLRGAVLGILLAVPALHAGELFGRRLVAPVVAVSAVGATVAAWALRPVDEPLTAFLPWLLLALACGELAATSVEKMAPPAPPADRDLAAEAGVLVRRLHRLADSLTTGFDAPAAAEMALQALAAATPTVRSAVMVGVGDDPAVPLAMRGADRAPWPDPTIRDSVLAEVWANLQPVVGEWQDEGVARSLLAVPLHDAQGERLGILVADRASNTPFTSADLEAAQEVARQHSPIIDLAVAFSTLREMAGLEERERLAREMHDGIAQEVVAFGFGLDGIRRVARRDDSPLAPELDALRADLTRVLGDLRVHIADLRIAVRPDTGLGAMVGARLQGFGTNQGLATRMQISETGFRLPAHTEVLMYRLFLQVLGDARTARDATGVDVSVTVAAPRAEIHIAHDGQTSLRQQDFDHHPLLDLGAQISVETPTTGGVVVRLRLRARTQGHADLTHERIPQFS